MVNRYGPKDDHCGTPWWRGTDLKDWPSTLTYWYLSDRYDWNHFSVFLFIPIWLDMKCLAWRSKLNKPFHYQTTRSHSCYWHVQTIWYNQKKVSIWCSERRSRWNQINMIRYKSKMECTCQCESCAPRLTQGILMETSFVCQNTPSDTIFHCQSPPPSNKMI